MDRNAGIVLKILILGCIFDLNASELCQPSPCLNGGKCNTFDGITYKCYCVHGWSGIHCQNNVNDCIPNPCQNEGQCIDEENSKYHCKCSDGFVGPNCEFPNPCLTNKCENGGKCSPLSDGRMNCKCAKYFTGNLCKNRTYYCPNSLNERRKLCNNRGQCQHSKEGKPMCLCDLGWSGEKCDTRERGNVVIGCVDGFCQNEGICSTQNNGKPICKCPKNFRGERCQIKGKNKENQKRVNNNSIEVKTLPKKPTDKILPNNETAICDPKCKTLIGNNVCEHQCNTANCQFDGGDCDPWKKCNAPNVIHCKGVFRNKKCNPECNSVDCLFDGQDCERSTCVNRDKCSRVYQNGVCNQECNHPQCGFDGGDCQGQKSDSFFSNDPKRYFSDKKEFELDLIVLTTKEDFLNNKSVFLQKLGSALKMVLKMSSITETEFNSKSALLIKLTINPTACVIYGGQCFSSLEQISDFIQAGINGNDPLSLPFRVAKVDSKTKYTPISKKTEINSYFVILIAMCIALIISLGVIGVLLRDKWGKLRTKVKTAGVWTPSEGYSTSTSSINSNNKSGWPMMLQPNNIKLGQRLSNQYNYDSEIFKYDYAGNPGLKKEMDITNRKRKYEAVDLDDNSLSFQSISENLEKRNGLNPVGSTQAKLLNLINENIQVNNEQKYGDHEAASVDIGSYVNEVGESLMHIASRMNCGPNIIKKLHNISPGMLYSTDEWGRTPLATAVASDAFESVEQLLLLEKQSRKESKHNKTRSNQSTFASSGSIDFPAKKTTGLIESVKLDSKEMINLLLDEGSPVNVLDSCGRSVVHWAAMLNNVPLLERLSHMKIFQKLVDLKDNDELSPLYLAASEGSFESAKFIVEYISKLGIKIDNIFPCPKTVALEKGFVEIESLINEAQLPTVYSEKAYKKIKLKDQKIVKKLPSLSNHARGLGVINEYKEYTGDSKNVPKNSPSGVDSIGSTGILDMYSLEGSSLNHILDSCSSDRMNYSSFKPNDNHCHSYLSNTSSSDMSPPLLNLKNPSKLNGYICHSDQLDPALQNAFFLSPNNQATPENDLAHYNSNNKTLDPNGYQLETSPGVDQYSQRHPFNIHKLSSVNCHL